MVVEFLQHEGVPLQMESRGGLVLAHMAWLRKVGTVAATLGSQKKRG